ncbi:aftiphilin-like isoform X2 [Gouania willdenowi]|uniref:aftiphilin-like isoform X2 n=1 Tax=Gouania willdenowi TaxID=441366 RepID=UPI001054EB59|nr:aftiphilin isoform X2 [Gouania willdenowi]
MERDIPPSSSSPPPSFPPLGEADADGDVRSEEDEEFGNFSVADASPCDLSSEPTPGSSSPAVKRSQPESSVNLETDQDGGDVGAPESSVQLTNGFKEESGFADFTAFTGQSGHPWCCGFSPTVHTEQWDRKSPGGEGGVDCVEESGRPGSDTVESSQGEPVGDLSSPSNKETENVSGGTSFSADVSQPNVSSLDSQDGPTDWDATDDDEDDPNLHHSDRQHHFSKSDVDTVGAEPCALNLGNLPPSDSFADFCSASPVHTEGGEGWWAEFKKQSQPNVGGQSWSQLKEPISSLHTGEEEEERQYEGWKTSRCESSQSFRVQQLLESSFPEILLPAEEEEEEELLSLEALLHSQRRSEEEETEEGEALSGAQRMQQEMLWRHSDSLGAVGLRFQWGGSRVNMTLLRSLGVDTTNIVFVGKTKQPVAVPAFASSLGLLEPTKDAVSAVCSPIRTNVSTRTPSAPKDQPGPSTHSMQGEELPSSPLDWSRRGLSSAQDGCSDLNLDYFGSEGGGALSSSSRSITPPPGVDPELFELSTSKKDSRDDSEDTLDRLMSTAQKTCISEKKSPQDEDVSVEAVKVITELPNLSFMKAKLFQHSSPSSPAIPQLTLTASKILL